MLPEAIGLLMTSGLESSVREVKQGKGSESESEQNEEDHRQLHNRLNPPLAKVIVISIGKE